MLQKETFAKKIKYFFYWYSCKGCGQILFSAKEKLKSGTGWPSFWFGSRNKRV
ncbi:MAG: peptide-methionine (R)-S-oxide reductase [Deltaproteobacteria bacterium]|nr:peptide-methionine (R)-S-oxide reductase [Deltaproteobacteria bacterium]